MARAHSIRRLSVQHSLVCRDLLVLNYRYGSHSPEYIHYIITLMKYRFIFFGRSSLGSTAVNVRSLPSNVISGSKRKSKLNVFGIRLMIIITIH